MTVEHSRYLNPLQKEDFADLPEAEQIVLGHVGALSKQDQRGRLLGLTWDKLVKDLVGVGQTPLKEDEIRTSLGSLIQKGLVIREVKPYWNNVFPNSSFFEINFYTIRPEDYDFFSEDVPTLNSK